MLRATPTRATRRARLLAASLSVVSFAAVGAAALPAAHAASSPTGIDISRWQHPSGRAIDWQAVRGAGHDFVIIKATESSNYVNPYYAQDSADARAVGMMVAAYDFARPSKPIAADAIAEARYFVDTIGSTRQTGTLPPVLDLEQSGGLTDAELIAWTHTWLDTVTALTGRMPMIYTYKNFWSGHMSGTAEFGAYPLWLAFYNSDLGGLVGNWPDWTMWQYTSGGSVPGIAGRVDMNRFNGTLADLSALANGAAVPASGPSSPFPPVSVHGAAGDGSATISWQGSYNGGSRVSSYTVTLEPGGQTLTLPPMATSASFPNLANGTTYQLTVSAANALGASDPVAVRVTPNVQSALTMHRSTSAVAYGSRVALSAQLSRADTGQPLAGRTVVLEGRTATSGGYTAITSLQTDQSGRVSAARTPLASATYRFRYAGGAEGPSMAAAAVLVRPLVTGRLNRAVARVGWKLVMSGHVSPLRSGFIYRQQLVGGRWTTLDRATVNGRGTYSFRVVPVVTGVKSYRLVIPQTPRFGTATSRTIPLRVR